MKVFLHTNSTLFTICQYLARCSRYVLSKFGPIGRNARYPYTLFKKSCSKWALKRRFLPNFSHFDRFFCVFSCILLSYTSSEKTSGKCRIGILWRVICQNWAKIDWDCDPQSAGFSRPQWSSPILTRNSLAGHNVLRTFWPTTLLRVTMYWEHSDPQVILRAQKWYIQTRGITLIISNYFHGFLDKI